MIAFFVTIAVAFVARSTAQSPCPSENGTPLTECDSANPACTAPFSCLPVPPIGGVFGGTNDGCCFPPDAVTTTPGPTTARVIVAATTKSTCVDLVNPLTGVSDCPSRSALCRESTYNEVMQVQCRRTCGYCSSSSSSSGSTSGCADLLNPLTGVSDCPARRHLCTNTIYKSLMAIQCKATCGLCSGK